MEQNLALLREMKRTQAAAAESSLCAAAGWQVSDTIYICQLARVAGMCVSAGTRWSLRMLNRGAPGRRNVDEPVCDRSTSGMQVLGSKSVHLLHHIARCVLGPVCVQPGVSRKIESHEVGSEIIKVCPPSERNDRVPRSSLGWECPTWSYPFLLLFLPAAAAIAIAAVFMRTNFCSSRRVLPMFGLENHGQPLDSVAFEMIEIFCSRQFFISGNVHFKSTGFSVRLSLLFVRNMAIANFYAAFVVAVIHLSRISKIGHLSGPTIQCWILNLSSLAHLCAFYSS